VLERHHTETLRSYSLSVLEFTIVGFGDWNGPNGTLIKRRYSGPLPEIKKELKRRTDSVAFRPIWSTRRRSLTARRGHV
jgi:hypothetical protein